MEKILKIPYAVFNDWDLLQQFLERRGNPRYEIVGNVDLRGKKDIIDLGNLVRVDGDLYLNYTPIESLGNLVRVEDNLAVNRTPIKSLGNLQYVGGYLDLESTPIKTLNNLEYVGGELNLIGTQIKFLGNLKKVDGIIFLSKNHNIPEKELTKFKIEYI